MDSTTDILRARVAMGDRPGGTYAISLAGHVGLVLLALVLPSDLLSTDGADVMDNVMSISLGGPVGASQGGQTALAARPVQEVLPLEEADQAQWIQPPAPAQPEEVVRTPDAPRRLESERVTEPAPEESRGRTPTRGPELREGTALADTGARGLGTGLSAGGLGSGGYLEVGDFCCPEYLGIMTQLIRQRWVNQQEFPGSVMMKFTIERDGQIVNIVRETTSGYLALDQSAERALRLTRVLPPLPTRFPEDDLTVHLNFEYQR